VRVGSLLPLGTYYVKVEGNSPDAFGTGGYQLQIKAQPLVGALTGLLSNTPQQATQLAANTLPLNDSFLPAPPLPPLTRTSSHFDYSSRSSITGSGDTDYFLVQAPQAQAGQQTVLTVMTWGTDNGGLVPRAVVYDANRNPVAYNLLVNENGIF